MKHHLKLMLSELIRAKGLRAKAGIVRSIIQCHITGIPTPYGFRLRGPAYARMHQLSTDLNTLRAKYDAAVRINDLTHSKLVQTAALLKEVHADAGKLSKALKEISNHPSIVSPDTQSILDAYRVN